MLKMLQIAVAVFALAFFVSLAGLAYYSSSPSQPSEQQTAAQTAEKKTQEKEHSFSGFINFLFPDAISIFTFWLVVATIVLGVIAYVQIEFLRRAEVIAAKSADAAKESTDVAKDALVAANRPWVKVDIFPGGPIFYNENGINFTLRYVFKNIGHSPATNILVFPQVMAPILGEQVPFDVRGELRKIIEANKKQIANPFGIALFPDETATQDVTVSIDKQMLTRMTQKADFILPTVVGSIIYRMGFDTKVHQTGFVVGIHRITSPNPKRATNAIFPDEGDVPADNIRLGRSMLDGGYAD